MKTTHAILAAIFCLAWAGMAGKPPVLKEKGILSPPPKIIRTCCLFGADVKMAIIPLVGKTDITSPDRLGPHRYLGSKDEGNGIIYTRSGGFLDLGHVRDCADWTAFLFAAIQLEKAHSKSISLDLGHEGGAKKLFIDFEKITDDRSAAELAARIAFDLSLWHEIATWYGASYVPLIPEGYSSFSPEDLYSNLLGTRLGIEAVLSEVSYELAMTQLLQGELQSLDAFSDPMATYDAMMRTEGLWWAAEKRLPGKNCLIERYFDLDQCLIPWLVYPNTGVPRPECVSGFDRTDEYELSVRLNLKLPAFTVGTHTNRTLTQRHFPAIVEYIKTEAIKDRARLAERRSAKRPKPEKTRDTSRII